MREVYRSPPLYDQIMPRRVFELEPPKERNLTSTDTAVKHVRITERNLHIRTTRNMRQNDKTRRKYCIYYLPGLLLPVESSHRFSNIFASISSSSAISDALKPLIMVIIWSISSILWTISSFENILIVSFMAWAKPAISSAPSWRNRGCAQFLTSLCILCSHSA